MKATITVLLLFFASFIIGCKGEHKDDTSGIVDEATISRLQNKSDKYFTEALANLDKENLEAAAAQLEKGILELQKESKNVSGLYKINLEKAVDALNRMETDLKNGKKFSTNSLREVIANAEINIAHEYLSTDNMYLLTEPGEAVSHKTRRKFNHSLSKLKSEEGKLLPEVGKEGVDLLHEGKKLDAEYKAWEKRVQDYNKKANKLLVKKYSDYNEGVYWVY
ncbi:hypothetical protein HPE56_03355 [Maribacter sp. ANRC-HE7]|uniref:Lipoprotein n=1 Tax=Maribacter aquimaris TaxID=2737171 RepID=A0ABR7UZI7_9FLAO|nr:hypothetical protein [Maribacter aquimaris]MBD0776821.1 hypothetical protein [Maribacter aquimaris]